MRFVALRPLSVHRSAVVRAPTADRIQTQVKPVGASPICATSGLLGYLFMRLRRETMLGGLLTILVGEHIGCGCAVAQGNADTGCIVSGTRAEALLSRSSPRQFYVTGREPLISSSGDRQFDFALAQTLSRLSDMLDILPGFAFYDGGNAYATRVRREDGPVVSRAHGTVVFGKQLLRRTFSEVESPEAAVAAICAHEFGHILQFKLNIPDELLRGQPTVKRVELHADFIAGYFAGARKLESPNYPAAVFALQMEKIGDSRVDARTHHGLPRERADAVVKGFEAAYRERLPLYDAVRVGIRYVLRT